MIVIRNPSTIPPQAKTALADIETTAITYDACNLMIIPGTVHMLVGHDYELDIYYVWVGHEEIEQGTRWLETCDRIIFHFGRGFDEKVLRHHFGLKKKNGQFLDSVILLRMLYSNQTEDDKIEVRRFKDSKEKKTPTTFPGNLVGKHSLEAWGLRIGIPKIDYVEQFANVHGKLADPWAAYNDIMDEYGIRDVRVLRELWKQKILPLMTDSRDDLTRAVPIEHWMAGLMEQLKTSGIKFNEDQANRLADALEMKAEQMVGVLQKDFPPRLEPAKWVFKERDGSDAHRKTHLMRQFPTNKVYRPFFNLPEGYEREMWGEIFFPAVNRTLKDKETGAITFQVRKYIPALNAMGEPILPPPKKKPVKRGTVEEPKPDTDGETSVEEQELAEIFTEGVRPQPDGEFLGENCYVKVVEKEFNPRSRPQIIKRLLEMGWEPDEFTEAGNPVTDDAHLQKIEEQLSQFSGAANLAKYLTIEKRIGAIKTGKKAWLKLVDPNGFIHPTIIPCSAVTMRATHSDPNISQVPSVKSVKVTDEYGNPVVKSRKINSSGVEEVDYKMRVGKGEEGKWGWDCRALFTVPEGFSMVGVDLAGIELRCWAHYQWPYDDGALAHMILHEDIHENNRRILGFNDRTTAKRWLFAMLYGGGDEQLGWIIDPLAAISLQERLGRDSKRRFMAGVRGFDLMKSNLELSVKRRGWLRGIDGRRVPIRKPHAALNTQLQSCGAIISKYWIRNAINGIEKKLHLKWGYENDYTLLLYSHDEIQLAVRHQHVRRVRHVCEMAAVKAGEELGMRLPIAADSKDGLHWGDTH